MTHLDLQGQLFSHIISGTKIPYSTFVLYEAVFEVCVGLICGRYVGGYITL